MTAARRPVVHIGLAKTASTFLQQAVLPGLPGTVYLGKNTDDEALRRAGSMLVRATSIGWRRDKAAAGFQPALDRARAEGLLPVYSEEDLSVFKFIDPETAARRLRDLFGPYDVVMVCRDPVTWVQSQYQFRLSTLHPATLGGIDDWWRRNAAINGVGSDVTEIQFTAVLDVYRDLCGGRVSVVPYELLSHDPVAFAGRLAEAFGVDPADVGAAMDRAEAGPRFKRRITALEASLIRELSHVVRRDFGALRPALEPYLRLDGARPDPAAVAELQGLIDARETDLAAWATPLHRLRRSLAPAFEAHSGRAEETLAPDIADMLRRTGRRQAARLAANYGVDLEALGLRPYGDGEA